MCTDRLEGTIFPHLEQHKFLRLVMVVFSCALGGFNLKNGLCLSGSIPLAGANKVKWGKAEREKLRWPPVTNFINLNLYDYESRSI